MFFVDGKLFHKKDGFSRKVIMSKEEKQRVLDQLHTKPTGGHTGIVNLKGNIAKRYYWTTISEDVTSYVSISRCSLVCY